MKFAVVAVTAALSLPQISLGFVPLSAQGRVSSSLGSAVAGPPPPIREAPSAGYVPDWEDRPGLSPEEYMESDMSKPDLSGMWECPLTRWDFEG
jgi:hypothetical protein